MSETIDEKSEPFDKFELFAAILLGLAAIGAAVAGYQSNLWGGKSTEAYGEAATQSTKASTQFNLSVVGVAHDLNVDMDAKKLIGEAAYSDDPAVKKRALDLASYLYTTQLDDRAYTSLKLPLNSEKATAQSDSRYLKKPSWDCSMLIWKMITTPQCSPKAIRRSPTQIRDLMRDARPMTPETLSISSELSTPSASSCGHCPGFHVEPSLDNALSRRCCLRRSYHLSVPDSLG